MSAQPSSGERSTKFCQFCGAEIDARAEICPKCGVRVAPPPAAAAPPPAEAGKSPVLALILSFLLPGLGQIYDGNAQKGIIMILAVIACAFLTLFIIGIFLYIALWLYGMYDAYKAAEEYNSLRNLRPG
ncbi:MAG TPA: hypothetical protein PKX17_06250 [Candidatus Methanomethylicus sp.]|jgi:TM2 domain-containing membrane protein YozV|nr:hypothetical protein [Candidatus Methanomethylicus sp.]